YLPCLILCNYRYRASDRDFRGFNYVFEHSPYILYFCDDYIYFAIYIPIEKISSLAMILTDNWKRKTSLFFCLTLEFINGFTK
ncbi:MAG: hypothetical protein KA963_04630, partial [Candidatus Cloacimonas sp.]|nr:hypothetical protein [Candidatus Cloacimonas sp.]